MRCVCAHLHVDSGQIMEFLQYMKINLLLMLKSKSDFCDFEYDKFTRKLSEWIITEKQ